jgi:hypothetical protein
MKPEALDYELLMKAKALIDSPEKWLRGRVYAGCSDHTSNMSPLMTATRFCSYGAVARVLGTTKAETVYHSRMWRLLDAALVEHGFPNGLVNYNDHSHYSDVMAVWDKAIAKAEVLAKG